LQPVEGRGFKGRRASQGAQAAKEAAMDIGGKF